MKPILIYKSDDICYNMLNFMAEQLGDALKQLGENVIYCDLANGDYIHLSEYVGMEFKAIIGFHSMAFNIYLQSKKCFFHDLIIGPKFNFLFDHPIWAKEIFENIPKNLYVLTHDRNYIEFIKKYYPAVNDTFLLPPGGAVSPCGKEINKNKEFVFIGTYENYRNIFPAIRSSKYKSLANKFLLELRKKYNEPSEKVLLELLEKEGYSLTDKEFLDVFSELKLIIKAVFSYYREKIIKTILESGISLTVFGDSWKNSPFANNSLLCIEKELTPLESLNILQHSKLSLNIMSWHKDGFNERIPNSMLAKCVVVGDISTCLLEQYKDDEEIILFDLGKLDELPRRIKNLLNNDVERMKIAERGYERAVKEDTWLERAKLLLFYIQQCES